MIAQNDPEVKEKSFSASNSTQGSAAATGPALRIEFRIPVEIVEPAIVQIVRREQPSVAMQMMHARLERHLRREHARFLHRHAALAQITRRAGRDDVVPRRRAAARARHQMIEGEVVLRAAELASEAVAQEDVESGEGGVGRRLHVGLERHHARQLHLEAGAVNRLIVLGDDVHAFEEHRLDGVLPGPQREGVIAQRTKVRIQHQCWKAVRRNVRVQTRVLLAPIPHAAAAAGAQCTGSVTGL